MAGFSLRTDAQGLIAFGLPGTRVSVTSIDVAQTLGVAVRVPQGYRR